MKAEILKCARTRDLPSHNIFRTHSAVSGEEPRTHTSYTSGLESDGEHSIRAIDVPPSADAAFRKAFRNRSSNEESPEEHHEVNLDRVEAPQSYSEWREKMLRFD